MEIKLTELVDKIIGRYTACGDSNIDAKSAENLYSVEELIYHMLRKLIDNAKDRDNPAYSVSVIGGFSFETLRGIKEDLDCFFEDIQ